MAFYSFVPVTGQKNSDRWPDIKRAPITIFLQYVHPFDQCRLVFVIFQRLLYLHDFLLFVCFERFDCFTSRAKNLQKKGAKKTKKLVDKKEWS